MWWVLQVGYNEDSDNNNWTSSDLWPYPIIKVIRWDVTQYFIFVVKHRQTCFLLDLVNTIFLGMMDRDLNYSLHRIGQISLVANVYFQQIHTLDIDDDENECYLRSMKTCLFWWDVAPFLSDRLQHFSRISLLPLADFFRDIHALLDWGQLGNKFGHVRTWTLEHILMIYTRAWNEGPHEG